MFYNVISGNGGNGLQVTNSNDTTIQANFFGMGADNTTPVGNALNGVLIEGSSADTPMGGPIPLGNVDAANGRTASKSPAPPAALSSTTPSAACRPSRSWRTPTSSTEC